MIWTKTSPISSKLGTKRDIFLQNNDIFINGIQLSFVFQSGFTIEQILDSGNNFIQNPIQNEHFDPFLFQNDQSESWYDA